MIDRRELLKAASAVALSGLMSVVPSRAAAAGSTKLLFVHGRGQQGLSVSSGGGPIASMGSTGQPVWLTLDLSQDDGARVVAAGRLGSLDVALKAPSQAEKTPSP